MPQGGGAVPESNILGAGCPHCGALSSRRLGECSVCGRMTCERCGSVQYARGERRVTHAECLKRDHDGFKMIKFVR